MRCDKTPRGPPGDRCIQRRCLWYEAVDTGLTYAIYKDHDAYSYHFPVPHDALAINPAVAVDTIVRPGESTADPF